MVNGHKRPLIEFASATESESESEARFSFPFLDLAFYTGYSAEEAEACRTAGHGSSSLCTATKPLIFAWTFSFYHCPLFVQIYRRYKN
jgi:hypothetical protein